MNGFGARLADSVIRLEQIEDAELHAALTIDEVSAQDAVEVLALKQGLVDHLGRPPIWLSGFNYTEENLTEISFTPYTTTWQRRSDRPLGELPWRHG
ncbi:hypothetical protein [Aestuariimicrobium ganziense]|uniref:hypothetical protein n=1 Tax=Aestuariimicrobium ganziense TaxID=2773677 RepID=UPI0019444BE2|nr:hypothetical protein [Aestuariimicrobium ganziense]